MIFDEQADRYDIRFDLADYYGGLHCGETFDVMVGGRWKPTRIEMAEDWYLVASALTTFPAPAGADLSHPAACGWFQRSEAAGEVTENHALAVKIGKRTGQVCRRPEKFLAARQKGQRQAPPRHQSLRHQKGRFGPLQHRNHDGICVFKSCAKKLDIDPKLRKTVSTHSRAIRDFQDRRPRIWNRRSRSYTAKKLAGATAPHFE